MSVRPPKMRPYELLARFAGDGSIAGVIVRNIATIDGRELEGEPIELASATDPAFIEFAALFAAAAVSERDQLRTANATLAAQLEQLGTDKEALTAQLAQLTSERDQRISERDQLAAELNLLKNPPGPNLQTADGVRQLISARRYAIETAGIVLGSQFISTERDEIGHWFPRFYNAVLWLQGDARLRAANPLGHYPFKPKNFAPTVLIADQVVRVYECMAWFINECFAREAELWARVDAGERFDIIVDAVNNPATWPANTFDWEPPA